MFDPDNVLALARVDLACYATAMYESFELGAHHRRLIDKLEAVEAGRIKRLMVFMPPRHGKSLLSAQLFPAWYLGRGPARNIISASYGQDLADDFGRKVRNVLQDPLHRAIFPGCVLSSDSQAQHRFSTTAGGSYFAVGRGSAITGRGASLLLIDDPLKDAEEARSQTVRRALHEWYANVAYTRLEAGAPIVIIQTRWHEDDLAGRQLTENAQEGWDVLSLPAIAEADEDDRKEGEALWPGKFPLATLTKIKATIGGSAWASLYQQRPSMATGEIFKREWMQTYTEAPAQFKRVIQSWDTAFKTGAQNDFSVCTTWGVTESGFYLLSLWKGRVEFPELKRKVAELADAWKPESIVIEDKASGQSLIQELKLSTSCAVLPVKVDADKVTRAEAVTSFFESGRVHLPAGAAWLEEYMDELAAFPNAAHDDAVDSTTQALNFLRGKRMHGLVALWLQEAAAAKELKTEPYSVIKGATELASAQKQAAEDWPVVLKTKIVAPVQPKLSACPSCGASALWRAGDRWKCVCGAAGDGASPPDRDTPTSHIMEKEGCYAERIRDQRGLGRSNFS